MNAYLYYLDHLFHTKMQLVKQYQNIEQMNLAEVADWLTGMAGLKAR